jgi:hypothetical protein
MGLLAAIGGGAFVLASLLVSIRLLSLARRTRQFPELLIGIGLLLMGAVGYPVSMAARMVKDDSLETTLFVVHALIMLFGQGGIVLFNWSVFRRGEAWAAALAGSSFTTLVALFAWQTYDPGWAPFAAVGEGPWRFLPFWSLFALAWAGFESYVYFGKLRKRLTLGLADAVTTDRLRLWAVAMLASSAISLVSIALRKLGVQMTPTIGGLVVGPLGMIAATAMWLAFLPPQRYVGWVAMRSGRQRG